MIKKRDYFLALFLLLMVIIYCAPSVLAVSEIKTYVTDEANVISDEYEQAITSQLEILRENTSVEMAIVTIKSLNGIPIEEYSLNLAHENLGDEKKDNGILILLAVEDREYRIEVGYGLEGTINAALAGRIGREKMVPYFAESNYEEGLLSGVVTLKQILEGDDSWETEAGETQNNSSSSLNRNKIILIIVIMLLWLFLSYMGYVAEKKNIQKKSDYFNAAAFAVWLLNNKGGRGGSGGSFGGGSFGGGGFGGGGFGGGGFSGKF